MSSSKASTLTLFTAIAVVFAGCADSSNTASMAMAGDNYYPNAITGEGIPNPNPTRIGSWASLPEGRAAGLTGRIVKYSADGEYLMEWGEIGTEHGQFRTPHALEFDAQGRLWVADRGNHRLEIYDQQGNYLESRYLYGRISDLFITDDDMVYAIDSESTEARHINWRNGVRIGPVDQDWLVGFIGPWESASRPQNGVTGEGIAVDADGNVYVAEGPASLSDAGSAFTKYEVGGM